MPLAHDPPGSFPIGCKDQESPAAIVPAYLRAGEVHGAIALRCTSIIPEERACLGTFGKYALVKKEPGLVRVDSDGGFLTGVLVIHHEPVIAKVCVYDVDKSQVTATLPALLAFERHMNQLFR
jgi:hypothetical protein